MSNLHIKHPAPTPNPTSLGGNITRFSKHSTLENTHTLRKAPGRPQDTLQSTSEANPRLKGPASILGASCAHCGDVVCRAFTYVSMGPR